MSHISYIQYKTIKEMEDYKQTLYNDELLNILPDGVIIFDTNGEVIQLNQQAFAELHVHPSVNDMLPFPTNRLFKLLNKKEDILSTILEKIRQGENTYSLPEHTFMQEQVDYTQFPIRGEFATIRDRTNLNKILFFFRNITVELTQEYILNTALQRTRIYPWYYDISRSEFTLDDRYFEHLGIPAGENNTLTMEEYVNMIHPDDRQPMADAFVVQLSGNTTFDKTVPFRLRRGDGTWEWFEGQSTYIANISGHPYRLVGICLSIQEYKDIENTLIEARKKAEESDRLKMAFLANMSHEIRTPLNAIVGFSELLAAANTEEEKQKYLEILHTNSELLLQLVNDILDLSKIEAGTLEFVYSDVDINLLLNDLEQLFRMKIGSNSPVQIITEPGLPSCMVHTDRNRIAQVVSNFVSNAIKFTTEGSIRIGYQSSENGLRFYVSDTGSGISADKLEGVFDRFVRLQSDKNGNGLGLSICKTIVNKLGGEIGAESEVGKGSTFWFTLPEHSDIKPKVIIEKEQEELPSAVRVPVIDAGSDKKLSILVAEDMEDNYRLCEAILASRYELHWAHNGEEAISLFLKFQPDIILMDIRMPEVNGYEATEAIRQMSATVPIIALTAFAYEEDRQKIMHSGFTDFLTKPISSKVLLGKLESLKKI